MRGLMTRRLRFQEGTAADLTAMARLHRRSYSSDHFLALLPESVLADYYGRFLGQGSCAVLARDEARSGEELAGFAVFGRGIEERIEAFKRDQRGAIIRAALQHPALAARKALAAMTTRRFATQHVPARTLLLSIAVADTGKGIGRALLEDMLRRAARDGADRIGLYVRHHNVQAINAYLRVGFRIVESIADQFYMERTLADVSHVED